MLRGPTRRRSSRGEGSLLGAGDLDCGALGRPFLGRRRRCLRNPASIGKSAWWSRLRGSECGRDPLDRRPPASSRPFSMREMSACGMPLRLASSACVQPSSIRRSRMESPGWESSASADQAGMRTSVCGVTHIRNTSHRQRIGVRVMCRSRNSRRARIRQICAPCVSVSGFRHCDAKPGAGGLSSRATIPASPLGGSTLRAASRRLSASTVDSARSVPSESPASASRSRSKTAPASACRRSSSTGSVRSSLTTPECPVRRAGASANQSAEPRIHG